MTGTTSSCPEPESSSCATCAPGSITGRQVLQVWGFSPVTCLPVVASRPSSPDRAAPARRSPGGGRRRLGLDLYNVDLVRVVSKYIGETEKNLDRCSTRRGGGEVVLLFDEADALFGKRSPVHDAHDRYANLEVAYLLQKMEEFEGLAILSTNLRDNLDQPSCDGWTSWCASRFRTRRAGAASGDGCGPTSRRDRRTSTSMCWRPKSPCPVVTYATSR